HCDAAVACYNPARGPSFVAGPVRDRVMSTSSSLRPRVADLVFHLYDRPLHPELFDTLARRAVRRDDYALTVRITRTGHALTWEAPGAHLTEVTAAADLPLPCHRARLQQRVRGEHCAAWSGGPRLH